ncbi:MAG: glycosyltransferase [Chlorobi bacterium]|nr:glycosyltransferase [Chlorobiota bacterium]
MTAAIGDVVVWERLPQRLPADAIRISVVIPTLQEERGIESLLNRFDDATIQEWGIEIIVSDGGSTDATVQIAQRYADRIAVYRGQRRQTIAEGRNIGAQLGCGETFVFLNADCVPANWEQFWSVLTEWSRGNGPYAHCVALAAPVEIAPQQRQWSDRIVHGIFNAYLRCAVALGAGVGRGECQIVRRWLFERIGGYDSALAAGEDFEFMHRARRWTPIALPKELLVYESPRRYRRWGYRRILWQWFINWVNAVFLHRSIVSEWLPVREE